MNIGTVGLHESPARFESFVDWAREAAIPLTGSLKEVPGLREMIGAARLVSLGEGLHGAREPLDFRNALFVWLVERLGFSAIAIESGLSEGLVIRRHLRDGEGDIASLVPQGITSGLHAFPQQLALLCWMRSSGHPPLSFQGIDSSQLAGHSGAALDVALDLLDEVEAAPYRARLATAWPLLQIDRRAGVPQGYATLPQAARDAVTGTVADLAARLERGDLPALARDAARAMRQADLYLRQFPVGWSAVQGLSSLWPSVGLSDRCKADNVECALQDLGRDGRMLLFSHLGHATTQPVSVELDGARMALPTLMGEHLKRRFGDDLLTIGHLIGENCCQPELGAASPTSLEGRLASLGHDELLLDLRSAPPAVRAELEAAPHPLHGQLPVHVLSAGLGVDVVYFTARATPAL